MFEAGGHREGGIPRGGAWRRVLDCAHVGDVLEGVREGEDPHCACVRRAVYPSGLRPRTFSCKRRKCRRCAKERIGKAQFVKEMMLNNQGVRLVMERCAKDCDKPLGKIQGWIREVAEHLP
mmetsp:Transcript_4891/g.13636  ORF Transcript_4891/g.13636 Transcript_4891/m.13636 type:complete len:121 (-) Transcript_4891:53-415(-)